MHVQPLFVGLARDVVLEDHGELVAVRVRALDDRAVDLVRGDPVLRLFEHLVEAVDLAIGAVVGLEANDVLGIELFHRLVRLVGFHEVDQFLSDVFRRHARRLTPLVDIDMSG
ncbi:MAG: hypothetical protein QM831_30700 [Kofleriaceae bacterium]